MKHRNTQAGTTLVELIIGIAILASMVGGIYALYDTGLDAYQQGMTSSDIERRTAQVLETVANDLAKAGQEVTLEFTVDSNFCCVAFGLDAVQISGAMEAPVSGTPVSGVLGIAMLGAACSVGGAALVRKWD